VNVITQVEQGRELIKQGGVIAYPTEAVYGLGCSPFNQHAVERILTLKQREKHKGLILLIANWSQLSPLIKPVSKSLMQRVHATWPGPVTWIFPKSDLVSDWVSGDHDGIAIRMSAHPVAKALCQDGPVVSTSANLAGQEPAMNFAQLEAQFPEGIDAVVAGELGGMLQPSTIYDVISGERLR
jgi:L-threonylcarbamoyladenylate synthase